MLFSHCQKVTDHSLCLPNFLLLNAKSKSWSRTDEICPRDRHVKFKNNTLGRKWLWDTALKFLCPGLLITSPDHLVDSTVGKEKLNHATKLNAVNMWLLFHSWSEKTTRQEVKTFSLWLIAKKIVGTLTNGKEDPVSFNQSGTWLSPFFPRLASVACLSLVYCYCYSYGLPFWVNLWHNFFPTSF